jgi:hypothetical protein
MVAITISPRGPCLDHDSMSSMHISLPLHACTSGKKMSILVHIAAQLTRTLTRLLRTASRVTFAQTPSGMMSTGGSRELFNSPGLRAPDSANRRKDMFRPQKRLVRAWLANNFMLSCMMYTSVFSLGILYLGILRFPVGFLSPTTYIYLTAFVSPKQDKPLSGRDDTGMGGMGGGMSGFASQPMEQDIGSIRSEFDLLYPQPVQSIRSVLSPHEQNHCRLCVSDILAWHA